MTSLPSYDPNEFSTGIDPAAWGRLASDPQTPLMNRVIQGQYAPGSVFKIAMASAALEEGIISRSTTFYCPGYLTLYNTPFRCGKPSGHGFVNVVQALTHSCNVFFYQVGRTAGIDAIARYADMFNIGRPTGIDLPGEGAGVLPSPAWKMKTRGEPWYAGETISVSIGQGILAVTPTQMAILMSSVATGQLYNVGSIVVPASCSEFTINLRHVGQMPTAMGDNVVITRTADMQAVGADGLAAGAAANYVKAGDTRIVANTKMIGSGETTSVTVNTSKLKDGGPYSFFCSFPGHSVTMKGTISV